MVSPNWLMRCLFPDFPFDAAVKKYAGGLASINSSVFGKSFYLGFYLRCLTTSQQLSFDQFNLLIINLRKINSCTQPTYIDGIAACLKRNFFN